MKTQIDCIIYILHYSRIDFRSIMGQERLNSFVKNVEVLNEVLNQNIFRPLSLHHGALHVTEKRGILGTSGIPKKSLDE